MERANTFKFRTGIYMILAIIIPFWIITFPLFFILAWASYREGYQETVDTQQKKICAFCKSKIPEDAIVCAHCRRDVGKMQKESLELNSGDFRS